MTSKKRVLLTCPPMRLSIDRYRDQLDERGLEIDCPAMTQVLSEAELIRILADYDGWIIGDDPATAEVFRAGTAGRLRAAVKWGVGVDNVDFDGAAKCGLTVNNTPGMFGEEVADIAICYLVGLAREVFAIDAGVKEGRWPKPVGTSLRGKTCALVGFGDIGRAIARRLSVMGVHVLAYDPSDAGFEEFADSVTRCQWPQRVEEADFVVLSCSLNSQTKHLINHEFFSQCKRGVRLVNVSRGLLVDEPALVTALRDGIVRSAALEVLEHEPLPEDSPLRRFSQVLFGSHNASNTQEAVDRTSATAIRLLHEQFQKRAL